MYSAGQKTWSTCPCPLAFSVRARATLGILTYLSFSLSLSLPLSLSPSLAFFQRIELAQRKLGRLNNFADNESCLLVHALLPLLPT